MDDDYDDDKPWDGDGADLEVCSLYLSSSKRMNKLLYNDLLILSRLLFHQSEDGMDENPQQVLSECLEKFSTPDYIMEPGIFLQLKR